MIGKIINGMLTEPTEGEHRKIVIANPTEELLKLAMGYKDVTVQTEPEYDIATQVLTPVYTESDDGIVVSWTVTERSEDNGIDN